VLALKQISIYVSSKYHTYSWSTLASLNISAIRYTSFCLAVRSFVCVRHQHSKKVLPYSLPSIVPRADPGVQAASPQVTFKVIHPMVGCHYCLPGLQFPSQSRSVTVHQPVPNYTAWWQRHNLPKVVTQQRGRGWGSNSRLLSHRSNALATRL